MELKVLIVLWCAAVLGLVWCIIKSGDKDDLVEFEDPINQAELEREMQAEIASLNSLTK
ncbi:hypothetical protein GOZ96_04900 [Agrobacterium vitis]|uniref:hypothetical protein n=1 Tax=Agrobacterium vitis TaxID=373 RepID=UPI0012E72A56|nr:hypothetical protein [Agrobacterium vitis]MUZ95928.1 hypothetical protein [Agrobacterium vitis]